MKSRILTGLVIALAISGVARAQEASKSEQSVFSAKPLIVWGRVSNDGKSLLTDLDSEWKVSNAPALKGSEGRLVKLKCYVDSKNGSLQVLSVKKDDSGVDYASRHTDSAFRR